MVPNHPSDALLFAAALTISTLSLAVAQSISTSTPVPPLQWIELTNLLNGASAPPLKDTSIGFDGDQTLIIFGGESADGVPQSQTFLLDLKELTWSVPVPPNGLQEVPPARSAHIYGDDSWASYRNGHVIIGGKGANSEPLSDVWEFDYTSHFWNEVGVSPGGPSARWSASGGIYLETPPTSVGNTTFYLAGGFDGTELIPLSDLWDFSLSGVLTSNNVNKVNGSWTKIQTSALPSKVNQASTVMASARVIVAGGCNTTDVDDDSCAVPDSFVINVGGSSDSPAPCPAPRFGGRLVPNLNTASSSFNSQAFLLLGIFNESLWDDGGGLEAGEVAVLDTSTGTWSRILPAGDPGTTGKPSFPPPREGAAAYSFNTALVGGNIASSTDTIIFGGKDANGNYLQDVWLLRAYNAVLQSTNQTWAHSAGTLGTGVDASGSGVTVQYMTSCATRLAVPAPTFPIQTSSPTQTSSLPTNTGISNSTKIETFDTSISHKLLSPLSVILLLTAVLTFRLSYPTWTTDSADRKKALIWISTAIAVCAYAIGLAGIISSFTSIVFTNSFNKRSIPPGTLLKTAHGLAGIALFVALYGLMPILLLILSHRQSFRPNTGALPSQSHLIGTLSEKLDNSRAVEPSTPRIESLGKQPWPARLHSGWNRVGRRSSESTGIESTSSAGPIKRFEVTNRPNRGRHHSGGESSNHGGELGHRTLTVPRSLSELSWLDRRRSVNAVGELDYALNQLDHGHSRPSPAPPDVSSAGPLMAGSSIPVRLLQPPSVVEGVVHILLHALLLGLCGLSLAELWQRAPMATFAVFLVLTFAFYVAMLVLAWQGRPQYSLLAVIVCRLRGDVPTTNTYEPTPSPSRPLSVVSPDITATPPETRNPYTHHRPPYRTVPSSGHDDDYTSQGLHRSDEEEDDEEDDDDAGQRRIEEEMDRRNVSIITVPKAKLWIANPT